MEKNHNLSTKTIKNFDRASNIEQLDKKLEEESL